MEWRKVCVSMLNLAPLSSACSLVRSLAPLLLPSFCSLLSPSFSLHLAVCSSPGRAGRQAGTLFGLWHWGLGAGQCILITAQIILFQHQHMSRETTITTVISSLFLCHVARERGAEIGYEELHVEKFCADSLECLFQVNVFLILMLAYMCVFFLPRGNKGL